MAVSRRNSALKFYVNGRRAEDLHGVTDVAGRTLSRFDVAVTRAVVGLKRRVTPAASRAVREEYGVKAGALSKGFKVQSGARGRRGDRSDYVSLWASTRRIPLLDFGGRWSGPRSRGARASIERGKSKVYDSAFLAPIEGRRAIRVRAFNGTSGKRHARGR